MDLVDRAQDWETMQRDIAVAAHLARPVAGAAATHCECGIKIPEPRRRALPGVQTCVQCQALIERRNRLGGR